MSQIVMIYKNNGNFLPFACKSKFCGCFNFLNDKGDFWGKIVLIAHIKDPIKCNYTKFKLYSAKWFQTGVTVNFQQGPHSKIMIH